MIWKRQRGRRADRELFDRLVAEEIDAIHRTARRLSGNASEAEDLTQEVFLKAWLAIGELHHRAELRPWLFRVLRNAWIDRLRKSSRQPHLVALDEPPEPASPAPIPTLGISEDRSAWNELFDEEVLAAIDALPEAERQVLTYFTFGELSYQEIAEALDCPIGTVMSRLHRARGRLQDRLIDYAARRGIISTEDQDHAEA
jgi:RNA polymerase sigma-70 factor, ECF subfamily